MLLDPADLIANLGSGPLWRDGPQGEAEPGGAGRQGTAQLRQREAALLAALGQGASLEELCRRLRQNASVINQRLLNLELAGLVASAPGLWWRPC